MAAAIPDPDAIGTRAEFSEALSTLRERAGVTIRLVSDQSGASSGTLSGWFGGQHVPEKASESVFAEVLRVCGVRDQGVVESWMAAVRRVRGQRRDGGHMREPYRGLESFRAEDSEWFFGRGRVVRQLLDRIRRARTQPSSGRVIVVIGASGSGKSSILRAGLEPALQADAMSVRVVTPGEVTAARIDGYSSVDVMVIDQFEELWTECADAMQCRRTLAEVARAEDGPIVVIGLRADYVDRARREPLLRRALDDAIAVARLKGDDVRSVIVEPARRAGWTVDPDLVQLMLIEFSPSGSRAALDDGALALLSHALLETWRHSSRNRMTVADYVATGGIAGAVHRTAESVYGDLAREQRQLARRILLRLIVIDESTVLRRRATHGEIFADDAADVRMVVEKFARSRLLTVERNYVEITHETLISAWTRLGDWVEEDRDGIITHRRLALAAQRWRPGEDDAALFGASELDAMRAWQPGGDRESDLNHIERAFLAAGRARQESRADRERRRRRHTRRLVAALGVLAVIAVALTVAVVQLRIGIAQERQLAEQARNEATARSLAVEARDLRRSDPQLGARLAIAAYRMSPTVETRSALLEATAVEVFPPRSGVVSPQSGSAEVPGEGGASIDDAARLAVQADEPGSAPRLLDIGSSGSAEQIAELPLPANDSHAAVVALAPSGSLAAVASDSGRVYLWNLEDPRRPLSMGPPIDELGSVDAQELGSVDAMAFDDAGSILAIARREPADLRLWDISVPGRPRLIDSPGRIGSRVTEVAFDRRGQILAAGSEDGRVRLWSLEGVGAGAEGGGVAGEYPSVENVTGPLAFSPVDDLLVVTGVDGMLRVLELEQPRYPGLVDELDGPVDKTATLTFGPDGRQILAGTESGVWVWTEEISGAHTSSDATFERFAILGAGYGLFETVADSGAERTLVRAVDSTGAIRSWQTDPDRAIDALCASGSRPPTPEEWRRYLAGPPPPEPCARVR